MSDDNNVYIPLSSYQSDDDLESPYPDYEPVINCSQKRLFAVWPVPSNRWGLFKAVFEVVGLLAFMISSSGTDPGSITIAWVHVLISYVISPIWQNYTTGAKPAVASNYGCLLGVGIVNTVSMCLSPNGCIPYDDWDATVSGITRFVPFSIYNRIYLVLHPGRELNPSLPRTGMVKFGLGRSLLLLFATSARGTLNAAMFWHAYSVMKYQHALFRQICALIALIIAVVDLKVYIVSLVFGIVLYPYMLVVTFALYFPVCPYILNPPSGSLLFKLLSFYWKVVSMVEE